jgi:hypothetical protein
MADVILGTPIIIGHKAISFSQDFAARESALQDWGEILDKCGFRVMLSVTIEILVFENGFKDVHRSVQEG